MIRKGDVIENPVTGETVRFLQTAAETDGELVEIEVTIQPDGAVAAAHAHPYQSERFEVIEGTLELEVEETGRFTPWTAVDGFFASAPDDRHFVVDLEAGEVRFGNGIQGRAPQIGERIYDGACGSCGFLCESFDYLLPKADTTISEKDASGENILRQGEEEPRLCDRHHEHDPARH